MTPTESFKPKSPGSFTMLVSERCNWKCALKRYTGLQIFSSVSTCFLLTIKSISLCYIMFLSPWSSLSLDQTTAMRPCTEISKTTATSLPVNFFPKVLVTVREKPPRNKKLKIGKRFAGQVWGSLLQDIIKIEGLLVTNLQHNERGV